MSSKSVISISGESILPLLWMLHWYCITFNHNKSFGLVCRWYWLNRINELNDSPRNLFSFSWMSCNVSRQSQISCRGWLQFIISFSLRNRWAYLMVRFTSPICQSLSASFQITSSNLKSIAGYVIGMLCPSNSNCPISRSKPIFLWIYFLNLAKHCSVNFK